MLLGLDSSVSLSLRVETAADAAAAVGIGVESPSATVELGSATISVPFFFRFLPAPVAFFREWTRAFSLSVFKRSVSLAISISELGRMGIMSLEAYASLH